MWSFELLIIVTAVFLLAGFVKGAIGLGLPTVSLALLTATVGVREAVALMLVPSLVTNVWQAVSGGAFAVIFRRLWPLLAAAGLGIWFGTGFSAAARPEQLSGVLGVLLVVYAAFALLTRPIPAPGRWEVLASPAVGAVNGVLTGLTGSFVMPGVPYLQALGLPRDMLIQAMGLLFSVSTIVLGLALARHGLWTADIGGLSVAALAPAFAGLALGQRLRRHMAEAAFRRMFLCGLLLLGAYISVRAFL
ncbi:sulfite exporter TauE/SafE family protein [Ferruginivarius sediminum]|uniref:Probable membrane transporter protein n=1 Tax=Ferruginivarius sediminum TaxID=2661937 RepID=A0A369TED3_9PROT|nr:sulfite exporter TauE/SafE family protein [Ferruginivarius sediminum]RDD62507.1 sulfite exporter TauE/SafE family protein [Ferruginivarius sediminum]